MKRIFFVLGLVLAATTIVYVAGCNNASDEATQDTKATKAKENKEGEHTHKSGAHGGKIVAIGRDNYHAEPAFGKRGMVRLHMLGKDETRPQDVESQRLTAYVKPEGSTEATSIILRPVPLPGDAKGKTSQFVGKLPRSLWGKKVEITVPSITIAGERFRFGFNNQSDEHDEMPSKVADAEERKLYLTPGGKYTLEDIKANGNMTASQKFKGFKPKHDLRPQPGDKICPVTRTKANPKCTWIIGGKTYQFCCPPCVDEFVKLAKEEPVEVKEPEDYVKKAAAAKADQKNDDADVKEARAQLSPEDRRLVDVQDSCPIMEENRLGAMGKPFKVMIKGQPVFLCCKGCRQKALADPDKTLAKVAKLKAKATSAEPKK